MLLNSAEIAAWVGAFLWPLTRVAALVMRCAGLRVAGDAAPDAVDDALALTWAILPFIKSAPVIEPLSPAGVLVVAQQVLIGLSMGFLFRLAFTALELGGLMIATQMGLGFASLIDPQNGAQSPLLSQFYTLLGTADLSGTERSFDADPVAGGQFRRCCRSRPPGRTMTGCGPW